MHVYQGASPKAEEDKEGSKVNQMNVVVSI